MKHTQLVNIGLTLLMLALAACGGEPQAGVEMEGAGSNSSASGSGSDSQDTPDTSSPTEALPATGYSGRLLYLKGRQFEVFDLVTGETTVFDSRGVMSYSPAVFDANLTRGAFFGTSQFAVLDLEANEISPVRGQSPGAVGISPDGQWLFLMNAADFGFRTQLHVQRVGETEAQLLFGASGTFVIQAWTADSRLLWFDGSEPDTLMLYDPTTGESTPLDPAESLTLFDFPRTALSPDGSRLANIPVSFGPQVGPLPYGLGLQSADDDFCFDSVVQLFPQPALLGDSVPEPEVVWREPGLIASSVQWLDDDTLLFVKHGTGECGIVEGEPVRAVMLLDLTSGAPPRTIVEQLGNADDAGDELQQDRFWDWEHLYSVSPDGQSIAWIDGGYEAGETLIQVTDIETGDTETILRFSEDDALGASDYLQNYLIRQVVWLAE